MDKKEKLQTFVKIANKMPTKDIISWTKENLVGNNFELMVHDYEWGDLYYSVRFDKKEIVMSEKHGTGRWEGSSVSYERFLTDEFERDELEEMFLQTVIEVLKLSNFESDSDGKYSGRTAA